MADTEMPGSGQETGSAAALQVVEALRSAGGGVGALRSLLAETSLSEQHRDVLETLAERLEARKLVDRAKGILMDQQQLSEAEAYRRIQQQSMNLRKTMREVAEAVILANSVSSA